MVTKYNENRRKNLIPETTTDKKVLRNRKRRSAGGVSCPWRVLSREWGQGVHLSWSCPRRGSASVLGPDLTPPPPTPPGRTWDMTLDSNNERTRGVPLPPRKGPGTRGQGTPSPQNGPDTRDQRVPPPLLIDTPVKTFPSYYVGCTQTELFIFSGIKIPGVPYRPNSF